MNLNFMLCITFLSINMSLWQFLYASLYLSVFHMLLSHFICLSQRLQVFLGISLINFFLFRLSISVSTTFSLSLSKTSFSVLSQHLQVFLSNSLLSLVLSLLHSFLVLTIILSDFLSHSPFSLSHKHTVWPVKSRQMSIKVAQKWFHLKN